MELIQRIGHPAFRLHLDVKAMSTEESADAGPDPPARPEHVSLPRQRSQPARPRVRRHRLRADLPGAGGCAATQGWVSVEVFDYSPDPETIARESIRYMRECEAKVCHSLNWYTGRVAAAGHDLHRVPILQRRCCDRAGASGRFRSCAAEHAASPGVLEVGFGETDITPKVDPEGKPVYLAGFGHNRKATGVHDPLMARAVVLEHDKTKIAIVCVDLVGFFHANVERVRKQLPGFSYVLVSSTHNHEGPDAMGLWGASSLQSGLDPDYLSPVEKQIVKAVKDADSRPEVRDGAHRHGLKAPELLHDNRLPDRQARRSGGAAVHGGEGQQERRHGRAMELPSRDAGQQEHARQRRLRGLHGQASARPLSLSGGLPHRHGGRADDHAGLADHQRQRAKKLADGTYEKTERYGVLLGEAAEQALKASKAATLTPFTIRTAAGRPAAGQQALSAHARNSAC